MRTIIPVLVVVALLGSIGIAPVAAQEPTAQELQILIDKVRADRKFLVAENANLTDMESESFWPLYDEYVASLGVINGRILALVDGFAADYAAGSLTNDKADVMIREFLDIEADELALQRDYAKKLGKVLPARQVARVLQIENKIRAVTKFVLAENIPLVE
jgi:hypothetical protein